jgi:hypothetical protein
VTLDQWLGPLLLTLGVIAGLGVAIAGVVRLIAPMGALQDRIDTLGSSNLVDRLDATQMKIEVAQARFDSISGMLERLQLAFAGLQRAGGRLTHGDAAIGLARVLFGGR